MPKLVFVMQFKKDRPREETMRYWREVHGPIAAKTPGLTKYVQNHSISAPQGDLQFDGIVELWFESDAAMQAAMSSPEWAATLADAATFADLSRCWPALMDEVAVL